MLQSRRHDRPRRSLDQHFKLCATGFWKVDLPCGVIANLFTCTNAGLRQAQKRERETNHLRAARATGYNGLEASNTVSLLITL